MSDNCAGCNAPVSSATQMNGLGKVWHKNCFICCKCSTRIFSFAKFYELGGKPLCANCFNTSLPTCKACSKKIEGKVITTVGNLTWHEECFHCAGCKQRFGDEGFFEDNGKLWHLNCAF
eukprot:TRINITY_DN1183_c0_g1_i1.p1 TRINITY_DN1183_c0_g1~~TRINITY_DN1183_c0_g1_i1.p1  ORF type:complete len:119 (+),score=8.87 TRINITY_DN1183_c0_g1_i1:114-470(+)